MKMNYVLVHGAWGGKWELEEIGQKLRSKGHNVLIDNLPGHGDDVANAKTVTMNDYVQSVINTIDKAGGKVVLVGHSLGGAIISQVGESIPTQIEELVYISAALPKSGESTLSLLQGSNSLILEKLIFSEDQSYATLAPQDIKDVLLNDIDDETAKKYIEDLSVPQAVEPFIFEPTLTDGNFGSLKKYYLRSEKDLVMSTALQDEMIKNWKVEKAFTLESGHFPIFSMPQEVSDILIEIGQD